MKSILVLLSPSQLMLRVRPYRRKTVSHESLIEEIQHLIECFESLLELYDRKIDSMVPFENICLATAKMAKLDGYIKAQDTPIHSITQTLNSFTPELYQNMERELPLLISPQKYPQADLVFSDFKQQVITIKQIQSPTAQAEAEETMTDEERKIAEMRTAFGR